MTSPVEKLEHARRLCAEAGVPLDCVGTLAVDYETAGRLLGGFAVRTIRQLVAERKLSAFRVGTCPRIEISELIDFMDRNRIRGSARADLSIEQRAREALDGAA